MFGTARAAQAVPVHSRLAGSTVDAAIAAATLGVGLVRVMSNQVMDALRDDTLRIVLAPFEARPLPVSLGHKGQAPLPLKLRVFLDFVAPRLRARQFSID